LDTDVKRDKPAIKPINNKMLRIMLSATKITITAECINDVIGDEPKPNNSV
jgi:hypothetical protein